MQPVNEQQTVSLADAKRILAAGEAQATEIGQPMNIAVVDAGGNLVAHVRMDGAWLGSVDIAINKAYTARAFEILPYGNIVARKFYERAASFGGEPAIESTHIFVKHTPDAPNP